MSDILHFLAWYLMVSLLGWLTFPIAWRLCPALADRGLALTRPLGLLLWGFIFWMLASLGVIQNEGGGLFLSLALVAGLSGWSLWKGREARAATIWDWLKTNRRLVILIEVLFFVAFAVWAFVRASNPNIETAGGEKTMELAFINAILRSPTFPPHDPWLSGYSISYYYFGYVMTAMLAKTTSMAGAVAHNLMLALTFAMSFVGAYGVLYDLLMVRQKPGGKRKAPAGKLSLPLFGPLFLLFVSNVAGFLEVLHRRGIGWSGQPGESNFWTVLGRLAHRDLQAFNFWTWLDILHLNVPPVEPTQWTPDRFIWWWQDSRVVQDYDLSGNFTEIIDEFPAFSYMLGDLHPHVLAMPFLLLAIGYAFNIFLGGGRGEINLRWIRLPMDGLQFLAGALLLGGLAFLNTWDILIGLSLVAGALLLSWVQAEGWRWRRLLDTAVVSILMAACAFLLYLPFFLGFSSQAGGMLPNLETPTRGAHLWVMFGTLFVPLLAFLAHLWRGGKGKARWKVGLGLGLGLALVLWAFSWMLALVVQSRMSELAMGYLEGQGFTSLALFFGAVMTRRLAYSGGLLTLLAILIPVIAFLAKAAVKPGPEPEQSGEGGRALRQKDARDEKRESSAGKVDATYFSFPPTAFVLLMIFFGAVLVLAPDYIYLRDLFGKRMNTIFKFYYQAWMMWSLAAAYGTVVLFTELRKAWKWMAVGVLGFTMLVGLVFPFFGLANKTDNYQILAMRAALDMARANGDLTPWRTALASTWTLDGARGFRQIFPEDAAAAEWLATAPLGVVAEAVGGSYSSYGRMSVYSGQPAVVGWIGHEDQWRGTFDEQRQRGERDIPTLYQTNSWEEALVVIETYNIRYIVVGNLERSNYQVYEMNFQRYLVPVFQAGSTVIYEVP